MWTKVMYDNKNILSFHSLVTVAIAAINIGVQMALLFTTSVDKEDVVHIHNGVLCLHQKG